MLFMAALLVTQLINMVYYKCIYAIALLAPQLICDSKAFHDSLDNFAVIDFLGVFFEIGK